MPELEVFLFGRPRVERGGAPVTVARRKSLALLAYLAVTRQAHGREALVALLWPELDGERGRAVLRSTLADLNQTIGKGALSLDGDQVACQTPPLQVDIARFHDLLAQVAAHCDPLSRMCDDCLAALSEAVGLYRADFLAGFTLKDAIEFDAWQTFQTESLRLELAAALEKLAQGLAGRRDVASALAHARRWLALDPLHEPAHRLIMQLHAGAGDRAAAVRQYRECVRILEEELGIEPETETAVLFEAIRGGATGAASPAFPLGPSPTHNLPPAPTPFIGRETELAKVAAQLADPDCRLLTILGPGGIGKTRLAIQAARNEMDHFAHGSCFVDLTPIASADLLAATILSALQTPAQATADPDQHLLRHLADKQMLLILDNYEHLLTGSDPDRRDGYGLVTKILGVAPRVKLVVTSRVRLNVRPEWLAPLEGLRTPEADPHPNPLPARAREQAPSPREGEGRGEGDAHTLEQYSATALFLACARRVRPDFQPTPDDARQIVHICRLLEGYPLAIELAAAQLRTRPLVRISEELEHGLDALSTTMQDVPARHRSMAAAFDHSWRLLAPRQQTILRQLSVFNGSWTAEAAAAVTGATAAELSSLTDASWLRPTSTGRYEMHMLVRQYCAWKLTTEHESLTGENAELVYARHAAYYETLLLARQGEFYRRPDSVFEMAAEQNHLSAAWRWYAERDAYEAVRTLTPGFFWIAEAQGWARALRPSLEAYARKLKGDEAAWRDDPDRGRENTLARATVLSVILAELLGLSWEAWQNWVGEAESLLVQTATEIERSHDERWQEMHWMLRYRIAMGYAERGYEDEAVRRLSGLLPELEAGQLRLWPYCAEAQYFPLMLGYRCLAFAAEHVGNDREAQRLGKQSIALAEQVGAPFFKLAGLLVLATTGIALGEYQQAEEHMRENLRILRAHGIKVYTSLAVMLIGVAAVGQGNTLRARACMRRALIVQRELGQFLVSALQNMAAVELALGNVAQARRFYREAHPLCRDRSQPSALAITLTGLARIALTRGMLAEARKHLLSAFSTLAQIRRPRQMTDTIATWSELLRAEGQPEAAAELCAALLSWPVTPIFSSGMLRPLRADLEAHLQALAAQLPPEIFAAATARGRSRQIDEVVAQLLSTSR